MNIHKIDNTPNFQGSREIIFKEAVGNGRKLSQPIQDILSQSQLRAVTEDLMKDLNCMVIPKCSIEENIDMRRMAAKEAIKGYETALKNGSESIKSIIK